MRIPRDLILLRLFNKIMFPRRIIILNGSYTGGIVLVIIYIFSLASNEIVKIGVYK